MQRFHVDLAVGAYDILFAPGLLRRLGELLRGLNIEGKVALVTSPTVAALYGQLAVASLEGAEYAVRVIEMPDGEEHKNLDTLSSLYDACLDAGIERGDTVVTMGGGVVGDTAGLLAATYMRGLPLVQVPTTLLGQVDASVGGKVAIDHPRAKNLIGAFYQPRLVVADPQVLETLPPEEFRCGLAEVIKAGVIRAPRLFAHLEELGAEPLAPLVAQAIAVKVEVVSADPFEKGLRAILNFGHTIGHGIETVCNYTLRHGDAVSVGMVGATQIAVDMGLCKPDLKRRLSDMLRRFGLPVVVPGANPHAVWAAMAADKKRWRGRLRFVLPRAIGDVIVVDDVPEGVALRAIEQVTGSSPRTTESR